MSIKEDAERIIGEIRRDIERGEELDIKTAILAAVKELGATFMKDVTTEALKSED